MPTAPTPSDAGHRDPLPPTAPAPAGTTARPSRPFDLARLDVAAVDRMQSEADAQQRAAAEQFGWVLDLDVLRGMRESQRELLRAAARAWAVAAHRAGELAERRHAVHYWAVHGVASRGGDGDRPFDPLGYV